VTLQDFRNIAAAELALSGLRQYFRGANGQGKSNLLEAVGLVTALRSFRTADTRSVISLGREEAAAAFTLEREGEPAERVAVRIRRTGKELWHGQSRVARLAEHVGRYPTVVFSSQDLQLVRGAPALRRRWLDMALASMYPGYLAALQAYARALAGRNSLLRRPGGASPQELSAFERVMAPAGSALVSARIAGVGQIASLASGFYLRLSGPAETMALRYETSLQGLGSEELLARLESGRQADSRSGATLTGPHRDDLAFEVGGAPARDFASEGQQRSAMLALRLAQAEWSRARSGVRPVLLADDVLGELDPGRRARFWAALDPAAQVIATGTAEPDGALAQWQVFAVAAGRFAPDPA
jgi:DNA replication and repair protein RecF